MLRRSSEDIFSSFDVDSSRIVDGYAGDGTTDLVRWLLVAIRGNQVSALFSMTSERRAVAPQPRTNFERATSDFASGTVELEPWTKTRSARRNRESHCREGTSLPSESQRNTSNMIKSRGSFA